MKNLFATKILCLLMLSVFSIPLSAQQITTPQTPSPAAKVSQTIGISTVDITYARPSVKGRQIWGMLVPYGWNAQGFGNGNKAPWRAGANENTTIHFTHEATVEGQKVPAGTYGLFFTVNEDNTGEVILSKDYRSWGSFFYNEKNDQLRAKIKLKDIALTELLTYDFIDLTKNSATLVLNWEKKQFPVKIEFAVDEIVMANAAEELKGPLGFGWQGYVSAANYAVSNKLQYEQGLTWIDKALAQNRSFTTLSVKARLLTAVGKPDEAVNLMKEATPKGTEAELNTYGYQLLGADKTDEAIEVFILNTKQNPKSANCWDSLGEAYVKKGDKKNAIESFKKSLALSPSEATRLNSENNLKKIGAM
jgi:tetratricopeptide (TPR) repeat protein